MKKNMGKFDFDKVVDRSGTHAIKYEALSDVFGRADLTPLWVADMDFDVAPAITQALVDRLTTSRVYGYSAAPDAYWQSIIDWERSRYGLEIDRTEITYVPGIVRGFALIVNYFTRPGDKIVVQQPVYHPFRLVAQGNGRRIVNNALLHDGKGGYQMDLEGLERIFATEQPRLMVLCNPHNPIGLVWPADVLAKVASLARKYKVIVVSDEIHCDLVMPGYRHTPFASVSDDAAAVSITFGAPSKTFNIPGIVSSWVVVKNPDLRGPFFGWLEANELDAPNFVSVTATQAAYEHGGEWLGEVLDYIVDNIDFVVDYCEREIPGVHAVRPQASYLVWLDCTELGLSHDQLVDLFVNKAHLALNDGEMFGPGGEGHMRLNVGTQRSVLAHALQSLKNAVLQLNK